jgi:hypothetical protein
MQDFEKLGVFYLGREVGGADAKDRPLVLYNAKDLVTHAVCVGMTGSGKTGLCIGLLEEAALDGVPAVVIDPKGDLANLLLTFPDLKPSDFLPWVNEDDARRKAMTLEQYAEQQAALWKKGLADWGQDGERIRRLREAAEFVVYTPGSSAGIPVSILKSFDAPAASILEDPDLLRERITTTVTSLLSLLGIDADPLKSREHILLCSILETLWAQGRNLDMAGLIRAVMEPPVSRVGVFDLEAFFPAKDRHELAMKLNNFLASPAMKSWTEGEPIDLQRMLYGKGGKPRMAIFSIAHLGDAERMFFVSLLLLQVLGWVRSQSGTTSLRAMLYMDEIFGYLPPVANPPSKAPILTLLKQARAFGFGVVLSTQNPVDLDYKALSNAGTWLIGRLQTEQDQQRVLDGLEGAAAGAGARFDRRETMKRLAGLKNRTFLMNNVHEDRPVLFESRWAMSYLRGPLTRDQIKKLQPAYTPAAAGEQAEAPAGAAGAGGSGTTGGAEKTGAAKGAGARTAAAKAAAAAGEAADRPVISPSIPQFFVPVRKQADVEATLVYEAMCLGIAKLYYVDAKAGLSIEQGVAVAAGVSPELARPEWDEAFAMSVRDKDLETVPESDALYGPVSGPLGDAKSYVAWNRDFQEWLFRSQSLKLFRSPSLELSSKPGESEQDFRIRLSQSGRERRDELLEKIRLRYAPRIAALQERIRRAEQATEREQSQARQQQLQTAISVGATILGALAGRRSYARSTIGRATTAARSAGRVFQQGQDVQRAMENVAALQQQLEELEAQAAYDTDLLRASADPLTEQLETLEVKPRKTDISVRVLGLGWVPSWRDAKGGTSRAI